METLTLTTPEVVPQITTSDYKIASLLLDVEGSTIVVHLRGTNGERKEFRYEGATAKTLLTALNKADLSVKSLQRRILERLLADSKLTGAVTGLPD